MKEKQSLDHQNRLLDKSDVNEKETERLERNDKLQNLRDRKLQQLK